MRQGVDPSDTAVVFDMTIDSDVVVSCVVVELVITSSDFVVVVVVFVVVVVSRPSVNEFNSSAQLDSSIVGDVGSLDVEVAIV